MGDELLEEYGRWYAKNRRANEGLRVAAVLRDFLRSLDGPFDPRSIGREQVQKWVDARSTGRAPVTVKRDFARLRAFLYWLARRKETVNPSCCRGIDTPRDDALTKEAPPADQVRAVLRELRPHPWLADFCAVLAETGLRPSELLGARGTDLREALLSIVPWPGRLLKSKWSRRTILLNDAAAAVLAARSRLMPDPILPLFANRKGAVYRETSVSHLFRALVPPPLRMTLYDFRHFFCSEHAAPGPRHMEIEALAAYLGHSPASTQTLLRWYADQNALRRGAPAPLRVAEPEEVKAPTLSRTEPGATPAHGSSRDTSMR